MNAIALRVERSKTLSSELLVLAIAASADSAADVRDRLAICAVDYSFELHDSLVSLVGLCRFASAAAMMRLVLESVLTGLYLLHMSDPIFAQSLENGESYLPQTREIYDRCIQLPVVGPNIKLISESLKPFHKLTHGDMPQLNRRRSIGNWRVTFTEKEIIGQLCLADILLVAAMDTLSHALKRSDMQIDMRERRDLLGAEISQQFGVSAPSNDPLTPSPAR